jgi:hypothetical protein
MAIDIAPLQPGDVPELGRFLTSGFGTAPDAEFAAPDVLKWKYLEPRPPDDGPRSFVARDDEGRIVGHVGIALTRFRRVGVGRRGDVAALHMLDWLGSREHPGVGASLMRRAHGRADVQYVLGGSADARRVIRRAGYAAMPAVPVFRRVLRPGYRLREAGTAPGRRAMAAAREWARALAARPPKGVVSVELRRIDQFGPEVEAVIERCPGPMVFTGRAPEDLNAILAYPRGGPTGWLIDQAGRVRGIAVLNVRRAGGIATGKVVDLFLDTSEPGLWRSAFAALAAELKRGGADFALACGGTPWAANALAAAGYRRAFDLDFHLRDRTGILPRDAPYYPTFLEADYAYT